MNAIKCIRCIIALIVSLLFLSIIMLAPATAYSDGPNNPGAADNITDVGSEAWQGLGNIANPDQVYAWVTLYHNHQYSNYLRATQYGFAIPGDIAITGIEVSINRKTSLPNSTITDNVVSLVKNGEIVGENKAVTTTWPTTFTLATYGGPTDLWGTTWTAEEINDPGFGAILAAYRVNNGNNNREAQVDSIQITVYYGIEAAASVVCGSGTPITYGESVGCTITMTNPSGDPTPGGNVNWSTDGNGTFNPNPCSLAGTAGISTCSTTYTPASVGSGTHLLTAAYGGDGYFGPSSASQPVTVAQRPVTVTADPQTKVYGALDPTLTYQVTEGSLVFGDQFTGALARDPGEIVGQYAITQGTLTITIDYDLTYVGDYLTITRAEPDCDVTPYDVPYDGNAHTATGHCTGVFGEELTGLDLSSTTHTQVGTYADPWTYTDETGNYNDKNGIIQDVIGKANPTCLINGWIGTYDGDPHGASGGCYGVNGEPLDGLDLGQSYTDVPGGIAQWVFTDVSGNYLNESGSVNIVINKANPFCPIEGWTGTYDTYPHGASGECTGINGEPLEVLDLGESFTDVPGGIAYWTFSDVTGNYNDTSGNVPIIINKANAECFVTPYDVPYDGFEHIATGYCTGVNGEPLSGLDLDSTIHTDAGDYLDPWTFIEVNGNYNDKNGIAEDSISKTNAICEVDFYLVTYDGEAHTAIGECTGVNGEPLDGLDLTGTTHTDAGTYTDTWIFTDITGNYNDRSDTIVDLITKAVPNCPVIGYLVEYDRQAHTATGNCTGVKGEDLAGLDLTQTSHTEIGSYPNDPWTFTDVTGNYTDLAGVVVDQITLRWITVSADAKVKLYGQSDPPLTYQITEGSLLSGDSFTGGLSRHKGENVGYYWIFQGSLRLPDYYNLNYVGANFYIMGSRITIPLVFSSGLH